MTNMEKWNKIVDTYNGYFSKGEQERTIQFFWETSICRDYMGFPSNEIHSQYEI